MSFIRMVELDILLLLFFRMLSNNTDVSMCRCKRKDIDTLYITYVYEMLPVHNIRVVFVFVFFDWTSNREYTF